MTFSYKCNTDNDTKFLLTVEDEQNIELPDLYAAASSVLNKHKRDTKEIRINNLERWFGWQMRKELSGQWASLAEAKQMLEGFQLADRVEEVLGTSGNCDHGSHTKATWHVELQ